NLPGPVRGSWNLADPGTFQRLSRPVLSATGETAAEYTSRRATGPGLLCHPARSRTIPCDLARGRLSDQRFGARSFRLYRQAAALNLRVRLRQFSAEALPRPQVETVSTSTQSSEAAPPADERCVPTEALSGAARRRHFRLRRQCDPLGEGHPCT